MNIGIIGAGNMGSAFAKRLAAAGHEISITAQDPSHAEQAASAAGGNVRAVPHGQIAAGAELLIVATPYAAAAEALGAAGDVSGKTVIDISNPLSADFSGLTVGFTSSAAEEIQKAVPGARIVKAFNTVFAPVLASEPGATRVQVLFAGDDAAAKEAVRGVIESAGFEPVDAGPLSNARYLEPLGMLNIYLGFMAGRGTGIAPGWQSVG